MIARFWDVNSGSVKIGGHDVKEFTCDSLLSYVSMVFQKVYLFNDTIENNIKFGKPNATHAEVVEAAKRARCHDFIEALPQGYENNDRRSRFHFVWGRKTENFNSKGDIERRAHRYFG